MQLLHETQAHLPVAPEGSSTRLHEHRQLHIHPEQAPMHFPAAEKVGPSAPRSLS